MNHLPGRLGVGGAETAPLSADAFATALVSGIHRVVGEQEQLNRINVFPVADGDTGTNLSLSLGSALPLLRDSGDSQLGELLESLADTLLDGARGNSGAIVAQFFQGMSDAAGQIEQFTPASFADAVAAASKCAHDALSNPREGTILSVIAAFAHSVRGHIAGCNGATFAGVFDAGLRASRIALDHTQTQLDVLRKAGVVDAGAQGFVALIDGMTRYIRDGTIAEEPDLAMIEAEAHVVTVGDTDASSFRYCTECIVSGNDIDRRKLRETLAEHGDSLVLAGTARKAKIHIHCDEPDAVFDAARRYGRISAEKADDLHRQRTSSHDARTSFAVITDSAADIPDSDLERLDIHMVPCRIQFGDRGFLDKVSISPASFFDELAVNPHHPTTSQPAPADFRRQFQFLASHFPDVLSINLTSRASGTLEAARAAAARVNAHGRLHVIDSRNVSLGQGLLVVHAAECAQAGLGIGETIERIRELIPETRSYGLLNDLRYAVRGGRVPGWVRTVAVLLRLMPIIYTVPDGRVASGAFLFGRHDRCRRFARYVSRRTAPAPEIDVAIGHAACPGDARALEQALREFLPGIRRATVTELGAALGVHGGPGTLVVSTMPYKAP